MGQATNTLDFVCEVMQLLDHAGIATFLLEPYTNGYVTNFFDDRYQMLWPNDILTSISVNGQVLPIARYDMLSFYRQHHDQVDKAYKAYLTHQAE